MARKFRVRSAAALLLVGVASFALPGCKQAEDYDSFPAAVRVVDAVPDSENLICAIDSKPIYGSIDYTKDTGFHGAKPSIYLLDLTANRADGKSVPAPEATLAIAEGYHYTAIAYGIASSSAHPPAVEIYRSPKPTDADKQAAKNSDKATVRIFNGAVGSNKIDLLINSIVAFKNVPYGDVSDPIPLAALPYEWSAKPAGNSADLYGDPTTIQLKSGKSYLVVVMGNAENRDLDIKAFED